MKIHSPLYEPYYSIWNGDTINIRAAALHGIKTLSDDDPGLQVLSTSDIIFCVCPYCLKKKQTLLVGMGV